MPAHLNVHGGPVLTYVGPEVPPGTPPPLENVSQRPPGFSISSIGCEQPYGMPTTFMESLHGSTSTYSKPRINVTSLLQG